jgi:hypothetical protein
MLGDILSGLTEATTAEGILVAIGSPDIVEQVRRDAAAEGIAVGTFVADKVRHILDHAGEEVWLDLLGRMSGSPQPGAAALEAMLARAFPNPVGARSTSRSS